MSLARGVIFAAYDLSTQRKVAPRFVGIQSRYLPGRHRAYWVQFKYDTVDAVSPDSRPNEEFALHVLFVCTGNICRSPTAERLATAYGTRFEVPDFRASSAGTGAVVGHPIHPDAALVLEQLGGDVSNFAARQLTPKIAADADLVLTMTTTHRDSVLELAPNQLHRTFTLSEAARLATEYNARNVADLAALRPHLGGQPLSDIPDPVGRGREYFVTIGSRIAAVVPPILELCRGSAEASD